MLSPSDFNNAVPQFTNGTYASNPINPQYIEEPGATDYNRGVEPLQTLPAQWWNWLCNKFTSRFNKLNIYVKNIFNELAQLLSLMNVTPDGTETTPTIAQLKDAFENVYPGIVSTKLDLPNTYVPQTRKVNGHALSADVTVTKSDVGLGSVANTGDSATPTSGGTTKFTTGGAYTELAKKVDTTRKVNGHALSADVTVTKSDVGLGSVVNTGDSGTPVSGGTTKFTTGGAYTELAKKAPNNHASTATTYGVATDTKYGHVKKLPFGFGKNLSVSSNIELTSCGVYLYYHPSTTVHSITNKTGKKIWSLVLSTDVNGSYFLPSYNEINADATVITFRDKGYCVLFAFDPNSNFCN